MMKKKFLVFSLTALIGLVGLTGCSGGSQDSYIDIKGSDTMVNIGQQWAEAYMEGNNSVTISVTGGGSGTGIAALMNDNADLAQSSRKIKQQEISDAAAKGITIHEFIVGQDAVSMVVHKDNPIGQLTVPQLHDIFTGVITEWSELGWADGGSIVVYSRQSNSGTYEFVYEQVLNKKDWAPSTLFMAGTSSIITGVGEDKNGIGYVGVSYVNESVKALNVAKDANSEYVSPQNRSNIEAGKYPVTRPLYFYINGKPEGAVLDYLKWVLSAEGAAVLENAGFYNITPAYLDANNSIFKSLGIN